VNTPQQRGGQAEALSIFDAARVEADRSMLREARDAIQALRMANERWGLTQARRDAVNKAIAAVGRIDAALAAERKEQA